MKPPAGGANALWLIPLVYFVFVAAEFAAMTHLALHATAAGRSALAVGLLATALWSGILLASLRTHRVVARYGPARTFVGATGLAALAMLALPGHTVYALWLLACFGMGVGGGLVWVAGESWLAEAAPPQRRGLFVGLFETAVGLGLMAGPALVPLGSLLQGRLHPALSTLVLAAVLMLLALAASLRLLRLPAPDLSAAPSATASGPSTPSTPSSPSAGSDWRRIALPLGGVAVIAGLMEAGVSALLPSVSMRLGHGLAAAASLGTAIGAGSALLQPLAGALADRLGVARAVALAWGGVVLANATLLALAVAPGAWLWVLGFALGGLGGAVYTLLIVELGHRLGGAGLVKAVATLVTAYAVGTSAGPPLGGAAFDAGGLQALAALLLLLSLAGTALSARVFAVAAARRH